MLHTRLATMDAGIKKDVERSSHQMHTSTSVLGTRSRTMGDTMGMGPAVYGDIEKSPRGEALEKRETSKGEALSSKIASAVGSKRENRLLNGGIRNSSTRLKHVTPRFRRAWMAPCQHGLRMNATERWAGRYRRRRKNSLLN